MRRTPFLALLFAACVPTVEAPLSTLTPEPRVLAVQFQPAEAAPGEPVQVRVLYANATLPLASTLGLSTAFCTARRSLAENGPVSARCYQPEGDWLVPISDAAIIPTEACRLFGPTPPPPEPGMPAGRPVDPDVTGGYYQPLRVADDVAVSVAFARIACGVTGTTQEQTVEYNRRIRRNQNPTFQSIARLSGDSESPLTTLRAGETATVRVRPSEAESYVVFDPVKRELATARESLRVSVYASAGRWEHERTGRASDDAAGFVDNAFTAPNEPGSVHLLWVLRDDRGGVSWRTIDLAVE